MSDDKKPIFIDGFYSNEVPETFPEYILGKGSFNVDKLIKFLESNKHYAINGYLDYTVMRSKSGGRYAALDLYKFNNPKSSAPVRDETLPLIDVNDDISPEAVQNISEIECNTCGMKGVLVNDGHDCIPF